MDFASTTNNISVSIVILFVGFMLGIFMEKLFIRFLKLISLNKLTKRVFSLNLSLEEIIPVIISYTIYLITIIWSLNHIGIGIPVVSIVLIVVLIVVIISFFLSIKELIPNIINGMFVLKKVNENDYVEIGDIKGYVASVSLTHITVMIKKGEFAIIPNSLISKKVIRKWKSKKK